MLKNLLVLIAILAAVPASMAITAREKEFRDIKSMEISVLMNLAADPCENYHEFVCGNWRTLFPASYYKGGYTGGLGLSLDEFYTRIANDLSTYNPTIDTASELKIKKFYKSCLKGNLIQMRGLLTPFGKMPALEGQRWDENNFDWLQTIGEIWHKYGIGIIFDVVLHNAPDHKSKMLGIIPKKPILTDTTVNGINSYIMQVELNLMKFLALQQQPYVRSIATQIAQFEAKLTELIPKCGKSDDTRLDINPVENPINLTRYLNTAMGYVPDGRILGACTDTIKELNTILAKTSKHTVANYIYYHLMLEVSKQMADFVSPMDCAKNTVTHFTMVTSKFLHRVYHLNETVNEYSELYREIVTSLNNLLDSNAVTWYDDQAREFALEKLHTMKLYVDTFDDYDLDKEYEELAIHPNNYFKNIKETLAFKAVKLRESLNLKPDIYATLTDYGSPSYYYLYNTIQLSAPVLLAQFSMISSIPKVLKYARAGYILGHEITHAFGGEGRFRNRWGALDGTVMNIENEFQDRIDCLFNQYNHFKGVNTVRRQDDSQSENISDIVGIILAYQSYQRWLANPARTKEELEMESLPNLNYTREQLFFIYASQTWCSDYTMDYDYQRVNSVHSIDPLRAVVPAIVVDEFSKAFNCPLGSQMNPKKKCSLA